MTLTRYLVGLGIFAAANFGATLPARAENQSQFTRVVVTGLLSVEIPRHWETKDAIARANVATLSEAITGKVQHVASLAVSSLPSPSGAIIRVSRISNDGITQSELRAAATSNPPQFLRDAAVDLQDQFAQMEAAIKKLGGDIIEKPQVSVATLDGRTAVVISYKRTDAGGSPFYVQQFHVPLESTKALITVSHRERDAILYRPIVERVLQSVDFDLKPSP